MRKRKFSGGFTLAEMVIAMALLGVIAASVVLFVSAMSRFSARNNAVMQRLREEEELREELDLWFSFLDCPSVQMELNRGNTIVSAVSPGGEYTVRRVGSTQETGGTLRFTYPERMQAGVPTGTRVVEVDTASVRSIFFCRFGEGTLPRTASAHYIFPITTHVTPGEYLCMVVYFD